MRTAICLVACVLAFLACGDGGGSVGDSDPSLDESAGLGTLTLDLSATDSAGRDYRLRNARFEYARQALPIPGWEDAGTPPRIVSSEDALNEDVISLQVAPGVYGVRLVNDDWYLERRTEQGWQRLVNVVLRSSPSTSVIVRVGEASTALFSFGIDGEPLYSGELLIGIQVLRPGEEPPQPGNPGGIIGSIGGLGGGASPPGSQQ